VHSSRGTEHSTNCSCVDRWIAIAIILRNARRFREFEKNDPRATGPSTLQSGFTKRKRRNDVIDVRSSLIPSHHLRRSDQPDLIRFTSVRSTFQFSHSSPLIPELPHRQLCCRSLSLSLSLDPFPRAAFRRFRSLGII
jgi:hypothetical protein